MQDPSPASFPPVSLMFEQHQTTSRRLTAGGGSISNRQMAHFPSGACKTLVTERMKRSGMRWREAGGQAILTLRGWVQSDRFDAAWSLLSGTYRTEVLVPDNEIELAHGRAA